MSGTTWTVLQAHDLKSLKLQRFSLPPHGWKLRFCQNIILPGWALMSASLIFVSRQRDLTEGSCSSFSRNPWCLIEMQASLKFSPLMKAIHTTWQGEIHLKSGKYTKIVSSDTSQHCVQSCIIYFSLRYAILYILYVPHFTVAGVSQGHWLSVLYFHGHSHILCLMYCT